MEIVETFDAKPSSERDKYALGTHGAQFLEVKIDEEIGRIRVTPITEATEVDHRYGRIINPNPAGYHFPCNADIYEIETDFLLEEDKIVNELGVKNMCKIGIVGIPAAIANAVFHATGKRILNLPITPDKLL